LIQMDPELKIVTRWTVVTAKLCLG